jgi:outer membrane protein assembly factor BamA
VVNVKTRLLPWFLAAAGLAWAEVPAVPVIRSIRVEGNTVFSQREISGWLTTKPTSQFSFSALATDRQAIEVRYRDEGYLAAVVETRCAWPAGDSSAVEITISVDEGRRTVLGGLTFSGQSALSGSLLEREMDLRIGEPLSAAALEAGVGRILTRYESSGYPFARCSVADIRAAGTLPADSLTVNVSIEEGDRVTIEEIEVDGLTDTDPGVVVRETRMTMGELYDAARVQAIRERLQRLNIFASVSDPQLYLRGGRGGLRIGVEEGRTSTFDGVIGYVPPAGTGSTGYVTGLVSVSMRNLFGTGRRLAARWQRTDRSTQELTVRYTEPWVFAVPLNMEGGLFFWQQDSAYVHTRWDLKAELMLTEKLSVSGLLVSDRVIPSADVPVARAARSVTLSAGGEVLYDLRDDPLSPTTGGRYRADYLYGRKNNDTISATMQRFGVDLQFYLSTFSRQVAALEFHGRRVAGALVDESDLFRLGGFRTLRGYREDQFLGSLVGWVNLEYRLLLARRSYVFAFSDLGYYQRPADVARGIEGSEGTGIGYGVGVRVESPLGIIGVSLALGKGDTIGMAKVHVGLINEF